MLSLKENPTLKDIQEYAKKMVIERNFNEEDVPSKCLLLAEEVGELCKAVRKKYKVTKIDNHSEFNSISDEIADILLVLSVIANQLGIDLEKAFRDKEEINKKRIWK